MDLHLNVERIFSDYNFVRISLDLLMSMTCEKSNILMTADLFLSRYTCDIILHVYNTYVLTNI